jgi:hypothetical protein
MNNLDRLAEIKARMRIAAEPSERQFYLDVHAAMDLAWLLGEVERREQQIRDLQAEVNLLAAQQREAFGMADELDSAHGEIERLRGRLRAVEAIQASLETADSALRARPTMRRWRDGERQIRIAAEAIAQARALAAELRST